MGSGGDLQLLVMCSTGIRGVLSRGDSGVNRPGGTVTKQYGAAVRSLDEVRTVTVSD